MKINSEVELTSILINPDHDALNSFTIDDIKDGAVAMLDGIPIFYKWYGGELEPIIDRYAVSQLDEMADAILSERKTGVELPEKYFAHDSNNITLDIILNEYRKTQKQIDLLYCEGVVSEGGQKTNQVQYACDGERFCAKVQASGKVIDCFVHDRKKTVYFSTDSLVFASTNKDKPYQLLTNVYPGALLLGYLNGQPKRIDTLLSEVYQEVTINKEKFHGEICYVANASIGENMYRIWFLPSRGCHIVGAQITSNLKPYIC